MAGRVPAIGAPVAGARRDATVTAAGDVVGGSPGASASACGVSGRAPRGSLPLSTRPAAPGPSPTQEPLEVPQRSVGEKVDPRRASPSRVWTVESPTGAPQCADPRPSDHPRPRPFSDPALRIGIGSFIEPLRTSNDRTKGRIPRTGTVASRRAPGARDPSVPKDFADPSDAGRAGVRRRHRSRREGLGPERVRGPRGTSVGVPSRTGTRGCSSLLPSTLAAPEAPGNRERATAARHDRSPRHDLPRSPDPEGPGVTCADEGRARVP